MNDDAKEPTFVVTSEEMKAHYLRRAEYADRRIARIQSSLSRWEALLKDETLEGTQARLRFLEELTGKTSLEAIHEGLDDEVPRGLNNLIRRTEEFAFKSRFLADHVHSGPYYLTERDLDRRGFFECRLPDETGPLIDLMSGEMGYAKSVEDMVPQGPAYLPPPRGKLKRHHDSPGEG